MPGPADVGDAPVDDDHLAVIEVAEVVEPPVDASLAEQPVEIEERALVGDDLDATRDQRVVERLRGAAGLAERRLGDDPDADALADLGDEHVAEPVADLAGLEAEDQDVDVGRGGLDVLEHPREERRAVDQQLPARRHRRFEVQRELASLAAPPERGLHEGLGRRPASRAARAPRDARVARRRTSAKPAAAIAPNTRRNLRMTGQG